MSLDVNASGKAVLIAIVLLVGAFLAVFAPSLLAIAVIFLVLGVIAYFVWIIGVRINRRLTGRKVRE
jgi:uncharacterized protein (DUF58 family)